jgi:hypothetical protein
MPASNYETSVTKISSPSERQYPLGAELGVSAQRESGYPNAAAPRPGAPASPEESQSYRVTLSEEALRKMGLLKDQAPGAKTDNADKNKSTGAENAPANTAEEQHLEYLKQRDREVRAHEQAHIIAGGGLVRGGASFGYAAGPDGKLYAVSGEVSIDTSAVPDDPAATARKMSQVVKAALAPAQPSGQDRAVASSASKIEMQAQNEVTRQNLEARKGSAGDGKTGAANQSEDKKPAEPGKPAKSSPAPAAGQALASPPSPLVSKYINVQA